MEILSRPFIPGNMGQIARVFPVDILVPMAADSQWPGALQQARKLPISTALDGFIALDRPA